MYYMHDYPDCARVCHSERVRDGFFHGGERDLVGEVVGDSREEGEGAKREE